MVSKIREFTFDDSILRYPFENEGEKDFLSRYNPARYGLKPEDVVIVADAAVFAEEKYVLLIKRKNYPYKNFWAVPGGFMDSTDKNNPANTSIRELEEETGIKNLEHCFVNVYSTSWRDPRMENIISFGFAFNAERRLPVKPMDDAIDASWMEISDVIDGKIKVAFDGQLFISQAYLRLFDQK